MNEEKHLNRMPSDEYLRGFINDFHALLWRIETAKSRIEYLNSWRLKSLGENDLLLLKSPEVRRKVILPEDMGHFDDFMQKVNEAKPASAIFRCQGKNGQLVWVKMIGTPSSMIPKYYQGFMLDVSDTVQHIQSMVERDAEARATLESARYPVMLVDYDDKKILAHNSAVLDLLEYTAKEMRGLRLEEIIHPGMEQEMNVMCEDILFDKKWAGPLGMVRKSREPFVAEAVVHYFYCKGRRLLRLSLTNIDKGESLETGRGTAGAARLNGEDKFVKELTEKLRNISELEESLELFMTHQPRGIKYEGIIFSDIYPKKNKVVVYQAGNMFSSSRQGEPYSYEGTIAENIQRFKLDHLIVDDTMDSIKAIDWALFVPKGIRSYFAKGFFSRGMVRTVMILCSSQTAAFSPAHLNSYVKLYDPFQLAIRNWRKAKRSKTNC